jgi:EAL domain-containing protein (putative c-di-GMP-specific phosphodiesterase class I)/CHASE2 domain-containing sensor protein
MSHQSSQRVRLATLVVLVAFAVAMVVSVTGIGHAVERGLHSLRDAARQHPSSGRYVLVEIDARSLDRIDHWPWPRGLYARAITQLERAGVSTIAFDADFSAYGPPAQDRILAETIDHANVPIILPTFRQYGSSNGGEVLENLPIPSLRKSTQLAAVNISADRDGLVRHYPFGVVTAGVPRPSFAAMLAGASGRTDTSFPIDGALDPGSIPRISFIDLIDGRVPASALRGKAVLIGATAIELGDRYSVPRYGVIAGPAIHLLAADTLAAGSSPVDRGPVLPIAGALLSSALAAWWRRRGYMIAISCALLFAGALPFSMEAANLGTVEVVPAIAAIAAGASLLAIASIVATVREARLIDPASGLPNRRGFQTETAERPVAAVIALRITNYSEAAGVIGQDRAAEMIQRVVDRLTMAGISPLYRLEEGVLAWTVAAENSETQIHQIESVAASLRSPVEVGGRQLELRCRFGLAHGVDLKPDMLADRAILAADHAAEKGTHWEIHSEALGEQQDWRLMLAGELDQAFAAGHVWVAYQPKLEIRSGRVIAAEALVRWRHPERGAIPPDAFIPALEASGRILDLTLFVLRQAVRDAAQWRAANMSINVAVNVSALLTADEAFLTAIDGLIASGELVPQTLTLEVTESAALTDPDRAISALERIAQRGIKLSIDDYGTGQSTLSYLKRLPAREIKIDKSFILGLETNPRDQAMVRSTIELAHTLGFTVVAEGIENQAVLEILESMGCDVGQGWQIGKPVPAATFFETFAAARVAA